MKPARVRLRLFAAVVSLAAGVTAVIVAILLVRSALGDGCAAVAWILALGLAVPAFWVAPAPARADGDPASDG